LTNSVFCASKLVEKYQNSVSFEHGIVTLKSHGFTQIGQKHHCQ